MVPPSVPHVAFHPFENKSLLIPGLKTTLVCISL